MNDRIRLFLGAAILVGLVALACSIALGHVEEKTSYGLTPILAVLAKVALDFSEWAFRRSDRKDAEAKDGNE